MQKGRRREKVPLSSRFIEAIDRAAMRAGKGSSDLYLAEWRRESSTMDAETDIRELAEAQAEQLDELIRNHGSARD